MTHPAPFFEPPCAEPAAASPAPPAKTPVTVAVLMWIFWGLIFLSYPLNALIAALQTTPRTVQDTALPSVLGFTAFLNLSLAVLFRWLFVRFLIRNGRLYSHPWRAGTAAVVGALVIFSLVKAVEMYGFILFLGGAPWSYYLSFWIPSFIFLIWMLPGWMLRRRPG